MVAAVFGWVGLTMAIYLSRKIYRLRRASATTNCAAANHISKPSIHPAFMEGLN
jgi:hypothetical protein